MGEGRAAEVAPPGPGRGEALAWSAALLFAFFLVIADLGHHLLETPWTRYALLFPFLALRGTWRERDSAIPFRPDAALFITAGLSLLLIGILLGAIRWGRVGAVLAAIGLWRRFGWGTWRSQALLLFAVPLPAAALRATEPLADQVLSLAGLAVGWLGVEVAPVALGRSGSGLALVPLLAGLAWYGALCRQLPLHVALLHMLGAALLAFPIQVLATAGAALAATKISADMAREALIHGPWILVALLGLAWAERAAPRPVRP